MSQETGTAAPTHPASGRHQPIVQAFFERRCCGVQYVVADPETGDCAIVDPVLDYDEKSGSVATESADALLDYACRQDFRVVWILDTHPHADHLSAAAYLRERTGAPTGIGERVVDVQRLWGKIYNLPDRPQPGASYWDRLFGDGDRFAVGRIGAQTLFSPGHTLASVTYVIGDAAFIHDTLMMPDSGTARCDFPGGDASQMWRTLQRILELPDGTRLFTGHDYRPGGREAAWQSTVAEQRTQNIHVRNARTEDDFVALRQARDATLPLPKLMLHALQVNIAGGRLPDPEGDGHRYLKIPLNRFPAARWE